jgi:hypothetical protein
MRFLRWIREWWDAWQEAKAIVREDDQMRRNARIKADCWYERATAAARKDDDQ